ncbi:MAG: efflux RND transporter periplasmic adaptor subunit, partial [bacterium]|nr:efflux RND transporter periplasmic adaptor subunit [bacterium]
MTATKYRTLNDTSPVRRRQAALPGLLAALLLIAPACSKTGIDAATPANHGRPGQSMPGHHGGGRPTMPAMAVALEPAAQGDISTYYSATASLDPDKQADILARVNGVVKEIVAEEGDRVEEGRVLLIIEDDEYRHRQTQARVTLDQQRLRFERTEKMFEGGLVATEAFDDAKSQLQAAEAAWELAALELSYTRVSSPFTGRIVHRAVDQGQTVSNGTALFTVADMDRLLARVHVPAREFRRIRTEQPVELVVDSTGDRLTGRIDLVSPIVDPSSGTIKVTVEVTDYPPTTRPGDFAEVSIVTDRHTDAVLVPRIAVLAERGERAVYVADGTTAHRRLVEIGFEDDRHAEIVTGLEAG